MPRLIVDDSGAKRAFRLSNGRLSIGSDTSDKLRLTSAGVLPHHAVLSINDQSVQLDAAGEVEFAGQRRKGLIELPLGSTVVVGAAKLTVAADADAPAPAPAVPARPVTPRVAAPKSAAPLASAAAPLAAGRASKPGSDRPASSRVAAAGAEGGPTRRRGQSEKKQGGLPGWVIPTALVVLGGGIGVAFFLKSDTPNNPDQIMTVIEQMLDEANSNGAKQRLSNFDPGSLSAEQRKRYDGLKARADASLTEEASTKRNVGLRYAQDNLLNYCERHIDKSAPQKERVRLFLERLAEFRQLYPEQKGPIWLENSGAKVILDQVAALEQSYAGVARLTDPLGRADVEWAQTYFASGGKDGNGVREYQPVFERLAKAQSDGGLTPADAQGLRETLTSERNLYIGKRIDDAKSDFARYVESKDVEALRSAAAKLVHLIHKNPDPAVRDTVAAVLLKFPNLPQEVLPGWRDNRPAEWQSLLAVPGIAALVPQMPPPPGTVVNK